jgi:hypothetical protein
MEFFVLTCIYNKGIYSLYKAKEREIANRGNPDKFLVKT